MQAGTFQLAPKRSRDVVLGTNFRVLLELGWNVPSPEWRTVGEDMNKMIKIMVCVMDGR